MCTLIDIDCCLGEIVQIEDGTFDNCDVEKPSKSVKLSAGVLKSAVGTTGEADKSIVSDVYAAVSRDSKAD